MSVLNKNHPFRETLTGQSAAEAKEPYSSSEQKKGFVFLSTRAKLILLLSVSGIVSYGYVLLYDQLYPPLQQVEQLSATGLLESRSVEDAQRSAGLFDRYFCRGMQRSRFCR